MADAYEKDLGQFTENVHLKAQRHIQSGNPTDHTTINQVQKAPHSIPITHEELDKLASIEPSTIFLSDSISEIRKAFQAIVGVGRSKLELNKRVCGVYVFTNLITNDQLVGSSMSLSVRLAHYFKPSTLATSSRYLFFKHLTLYKYSDLKLDIYIVKNGYAVEDLPKLQSLVLCLEQYSIFTLNSSLNTMKVAGVTPPTSEKVKSSIIKANYVPVYVYVNDILIYICSSAAQLQRETDISRATISLATANPNRLVFGKFFITQQAHTQSVLSTCVLLSTEQFVDLVKEARSIFTKFPKPHLTPENRLAVNTQKIGVTAFDTETGKTYYKESIYQMNLFTRTLGPVKYVSMDTIRKCISKGTTYKG